MFHPLITPLNTYMYTTDIQDNGTVSATDEERLPPGGFSLRHGFPAWFGRGGRGSRVTAGITTAQTPQRDGGSQQSTPASQQVSPAGGSHLQSGRAPEVSTYDVLRYLRSAFDDEAILDRVPLEAAGNPGAWHAWRTHRRSQVRARTPSLDGDLAWHPGLPGNEELAQERRRRGSSVTTLPLHPHPAAPAPAAKKPGEWNWEHVWEERVKKGIAASLSEPVLYGNAAAADDVVSTSCLDEPTFSPPWEGAD
jgi:hypothetical protein